MESLLFTREDLKKLIVPLIIEQALALSIGLFDTLMVSSCGEAAVSGVSLVDSISTLLIQILSALATGGAVVCSQYIGKKMPERAKLSAGQLMFIMLMSAGTVMVVILLSYRFLLRAIFGQIDADVMRMRRFILSPRHILPVSGAFTTRERRCSGQSETVRSACIQAWS